MTILSGWPTTAMWQRQRASKSHWCEKNWNLRECSNCGMAWLGMVWLGVPWQRRLTALLIATVGEWASFGVCKCICLCVCGWRRLHTSMLMLACLAATSVVDILSLPLPLPWQAGSGRVSLVRFGILGGTLWGKVGRLRVGAASYWMRVCVRWCGCWNFYCRLRQYAAAAATTSRAIETTITDT